MVVVWRKIPQQNETITFKHDLNFREGANKQVISSQADSLI
ncbi:ABC transporter ATP-binding protein, partial [Klebsiella pneumoniae]